jgi:hypothetical protein
MCERVFEVAGANRVSIALYSYYEAMGTQFAPATSKTRSHLSMQTYKKPLLMLVLLLLLLLCPYMPLAQQVCAYLSHVQSL